MKNIKIVNYINLILIVFSTLAIVLDLIQCQFFTQMVFSLAFLSVIFLFVNFFLIKKTLKEEEHKPESFEEKKNKEEVQEETEEDEENRCLELVERIDTKLPIEEVINLKFQKLSEAIQLLAGLAYIIEKDTLKLSTTYALTEKNQKSEIKLGDGLTGQVAVNGLPIEVDIKEQIDIEIISGLGKSKPNFLYILPVYKKKKIIGVIELATFNKLSERRINFLIEAFEK